MDTPVPLLTIDCSTRWCVLALRSTAGVARFVADLDRGHSQYLLPAIESLRDEAGLGSGPLAGLGVVVGPGSFTGVRIAVATAQALAFAYGCPVARLDALEVLAESAAVVTPAAAVKPGSTDIVCCARRSRAALYYVGAYLRQGRYWQRLGKLELIGSGAALDAWWRSCAQTAKLEGLSIPERAADVDWYGDAPPWSPAAARAVEPSPEAMLKAAERAFAEGRVVAAADALPLYLEADSPWQRSTA